MARLRLITLNSRENPHFDDSFIEIKK